MIIYGKAIHKKYHKVIVIVLVVIISLFLISCSKIYDMEFDPTTATIRAVFNSKGN